MAKQTPCPCCSGASFRDCCRPYLLGKSAAPTALALMRSRYSAYTRLNIKYLAATSADQAAKAFDAESSLQWARSVRWDGLEIVRYEQGQAGDETGLVEFVASYTQNQQKLNLHEISKFHYRGGKWYYVGGKFE